MTKTHYIVVFDDGETFAPIEQCRIMEITEKAIDKLDSGVYPKHLPKKLVKDSFKLLSLDPRFLC